MISKTNQITGHEITLLMPSPKKAELFGWIRLTNGDDDAGYVYLRSEPLKPRLNSTGTYIVTSISLDRVEMLLNLLRTTPLQIQFFDPEVADVDPTVIIDFASATVGANAIRLPDEEMHQFADLMGTDKN